MNLHFVKKNNYIHQVINYWLIKRERYYTIDCSKLIKIAFVCYRIVLIALEFL